MGTIDASCLPCCASSSGGSSSESSGSTSEPESSGIVTEGWCWHLFHVRFDCGTQTFGTVQHVVARCGDTFGQTPEQWVRSDVQPGESSSSASESSSGEGCDYWFVRLGLTCSDVEDCGTPPVTPDPPE